MPSPSVPHDRLSAARSAARRTPHQLLRASVDRLAGLAEGGAGLDELVDELHELDRAVACLLGSRGPRPPWTPGAAAPLGSAADDWTTTGVLR